MATPVAGGRAAVRYGAVVAVHVRVAANAAPVGAQPLARLRTSALVAARAAPPIEALTAGHRRGVAEEACTVRTFLRADRLSAKRAAPAIVAAALARTRARAVAAAPHWADSMVAQRAAPPVEAMADAGRGTRAVAVTARLALRLGAVVPAPSNLTAALARSLAAAVPRASIGALRHAAALAAPPIEAGALAGGAARAVAAAVVGARGVGALDAAPPWSASTHPRLRALSAAVHLAAAVDTAVGCGARVALPSGDTFTLVRGDARTARSAAPLRTLGLRAVGAKEALLAAARVGRHALATAGAAVRTREGAAVVAAVAEVASARLRGGAHSLFDLFVAVTKGRTRRQCAVEPTPSRLASAAALGVARPVRGPRAVVEARGRAAGDEDAIV